MNNAQKFFRWFFDQRFWCLFTLKIGLFCFFFKTLSFFFYKVQAFIHISFLPFVELIILLSITGGLLNNILKSFLFAFNLYQELLKIEDANRLNECLFKKYHQSFNLSLPFNPFGIYLLNLFKTKKHYSFFHIYEYANKITNSTHMLHKIVFHMNFLKMTFQFCSILFFSYNFSLNYLSIFFIIVFHCFFAYYFNIIKNYLNIHIYEQKHAFIDFLNPQDEFLPEKTLSIIADWNLQHDLNKKTNYLKYFPIATSQKTISTLRKQNWKWSYSPSMKEKFYDLYSLLFYPLILDKYKLLLLDYYKVEKKYKSFKFFVSSYNPHVELLYTDRRHYSMIKKKHGIFLNKNIVVPKWFFELNTHPMIYKVEQEIDFSFFEKTIKQQQNFEHKIQVFSLEILHVIKSLHFWHYERKDNIVAGYEHIKKMALDLGINSFEIIEDLFGLSSENLDFATLLNSGHEREILSILNPQGKTNKKSLL